MFLKIVGIFAEFERENLAERIRLGLERKAKEGYTINSHIPSFGYNRENGVKIQEVNEEEAETVRRIFKMYLHDNLNYTQIADTLNAEKVPTKLNRVWAVKTITNVLTNPNYIGKVRYAMEDSTRYFEVDGHHTPILDETTYYQAQEKIGKVEKVSRTKHPKSNIYFCGVLYCQVCGNKFTTSWDNKKKKVLKDGRPAAYGSYRCTGYKKCCTAQFIAHSKMEKAFENYLTNYENFKLLDNTQENTNTPQIDNSVEIAAMTAEIKQIEKKTEEVMSLYIGNTIDFPTYQSMVKLSNERRGELETRLKLLQNAQQEKSITYTTADIIDSFRESWKTLDNEQRQQFVQKFIKKMTVHSNTENGKWKSEVVIDEILFNSF